MVTAACFNTHAKQVRDLTIRAPLRRRLEASARASAILHVLNAGFATSLAHLTALQAQMVHDAMNCLRLHFAACA